MLKQVNLFILINKQPSASNNPAIYSIFNLCKLLSIIVVFTLFSLQVLYNSFFSSELFGKFVSLLNLYKQNYFAD